MNYWIKWTLFGVVAWFVLDAGFTYLQEHIEAEVEALHAHAQERADEHF